MDSENVALMKNAVKDLEKAIKKERTRIENESYEYIEGQKQRDLDRLDGMISAKIFFEKYYKRYLHQMNE